MAHWVDPHGKEITEFAGHSDDCGPAANEVALATVQARSPTTAHMNAIRARDLAAGIFRNGGGQNVYELVQDVQRFEPGVKVKQTPTSVNFDATPAKDAAYFETVHQALKDAMSRHNACVVNVGNAAALPGNEHGVQWHFVTCIGIDDALGYLICNGDEVPFDGVPNWVTWKQLLAARPVAIVEYLKGASPVSNPIPAPLPSPAPGVPAGWHDDGKLLLAPNGMVVKGGFREHILTTAEGWRPTNVPLEKEHLDPDKVIRQLFLYWELQYTDAAGVAYARIGDEMQALQNKVHDLEDQIAALQAKGNVSSEGASAIGVLDHLIDHLKIYGSFK
jgi:hypothetical protein